MKVPIEVSARHVHLDRATFAKLFGEEAELNPLKSLSQPGTFAAEQIVTIKSAAGEITNVRILGPLRSYNQVEISKTDAFTLKVDPPIRDTHELSMAGSPGIILIGPKGQVALKKGLVIAWRHIHLNNNQALEMGLENGQLVKVDIDNNPRSLVFENVLIRVSPEFDLIMHIDTDEANGAGINGRGVGTIIKGGVQPHQGGS